MTKAQPKSIILSLFSIGIGLINAGLIGLVVIFTPIISQEINYSRHQRQLNKLAAKAEAENKPVIQDLKPVNRRFTLIIPKINVNVPVITDVDPFNFSEYKAALKQGVAHASHSALPDEFGSTFLFAHSSSSMLTGSQYNAVFYLLNKIETGDKIWLVYKDTKYQYSVTKTTKVAEHETEYLHQDQNQLILMTCSPPGTDLKRLLIFAQPLN